MPALEERARTSPSVTSTPGDLSEGSTFRRERSAGPERSLSRKGSMSGKRRDKFTQRHGEHAAAKFVEQVRSVKLQIRHHERHTKWVLHPGKKNIWLNCWDVVTGSALLYTAYAIACRTGGLAASALPLSR